MTNQRAREALRAPRYCDALSFTTITTTMGSKTYYVYILTNRRRTVLYTGMTNNLNRRLAEHRSGAQSGFMRTYNVHLLMYYETYSDVHAAIAREKQIKAGSREDKIALINSTNPDWRPLLR